MWIPELFSTRNLPQKNNKVCSGEVHTHTLAPARLCGIINVCDANYCCCFAFGKAYYAKYLYVNTRCVYDIHDTQYRIWDEIFAANG